jgi:hypothetical protein
MWMAVSGGAIMPLRAEFPERLFDRATLSGWRVIDGPDSAFHVVDGTIAIHPGSGHPAWLRTEREFENFDFRCEVFIQGWANGGLFFSAPLYGRPAECGFKINLFQKTDDLPVTESMGSIFPVVAPRKVNVRNKGEWNEVRVRLDWPSLQVWINGEMVHDLDCDAHPELRFRRRDGFLGIESLSYPLRFRNLTVQPLPSRTKWESLYRSPADLAHWTVTEKAKYEALGPVLRGDGLGNLATKEHFLDFELDCYIRASKHSNGGILFRSRSGKPDDPYEIQLHDVEGAVYPTGSLYHYARCRLYPRIEPERWFPLQLLVQGQRCVVRVNGDTVVDWTGLRQDPGPIQLQAHEMGKWIEYQRIRVRRL